MFSEQSDEALCCQAAQGDHLAEEALVARHRRLVLICCRPFFLAGGDSEDLIQEGMVGLLSAVRMYDPSKGASFHTYAEICIKHRLISAIKAASREKHAPLNDSVSFDDPLLNDYAYGADQQHLEDPETIMIGREEFRERMDALRGSLTDLEANILGLYLEGYSYREIAAQVKRSPKSVDNAVQRIRYKTARQFPFGDISES